MYFSALAGIVLALLIIALVISRANAALWAAHEAIEHLAQTIEHGSEGVSEGELTARITAQDTKLDGLQIVWNDFLDKASRAAARLEGAKGGRPPRRARERVEEPDDDELLEEHGGTGPSTRVLPMPNGVAGVRGARGDPFAALPPMRLKG